MKWRADHGHDDDEKSACVCVYIYFFSGPISRYIDDQQRPTIPTNPANDNDRSKNQRRK